MIEGLECLAYIQMLHEAQARGHITGLRCEWNPAQSRIEIYCKPTKPVPYITLNFTATKTGVTFEEVLSTKGK